MKIALVMPKSTFLEDAMIMQPLGLMYLAGQLEHLGHTTDFFDMNVDGLPDDNYDQIWVSATSPQMAEIKRIGKITSTYSAKTVLGGASVWANPDSCKDLGYDVIVGGESDSPHNIQKVLDTPSGHLALPISPNLNWVLPPVRRWSRKYHSYLSDLQGNRHDATTMFTSRGCPLECAFCESGRHGVIWDRLTRYEPLEMVEEQIKECKTLGYSALAYYDDILPLNKKRTYALMELHRKYTVIWRCFLRSDIINNHGGYDYLREMRDGGLVEIFVGVESASNTIKDGITKKTTIEQDTNIVEWCKELGIRCKTSFILGLPGETMETMQLTRQWILKHRPHRVQVGRLIPFKGTPLGDHPENFDIKYENPPDDEWFYRGNMDTDSHSFVSTSALSVQEIDTFWRDLEKELEMEGINK
jgi:radical SAM superfamily enzyme YgiQ (UPF0313 family)